MKSKLINKRLFLRSFFYYLFHQKSEYQKSVLKFCMDFHEHGLVSGLKEQFNIDTYVAIRLVDFAKTKYGYDISSIAAEEVYQVKKYCFTKCYYNKLKKWKK